MAYVDVEIFNKILSIYYEPNDIFLHIKQSIQLQTGIPVGSQKLVYVRDEPDDSDLIVNVISSIDPIIHLAIRLSRKLKYALI